jgi:hypothetical protein
MLTSRAPSTTQSSLLQIQLVLLFHGLHLARLDLKVHVSQLHSQHRLAAEAAARRAQEHGLKKVDVFVKGPGSGRETAIRSLQAAGLEVGAIADVTPAPHNGCRPPKPRRV